MKSMRITGGKYRGRQVRCPKGIIRPAMARMREALFSILGDISAVSFLDLFSGSGLVGLEAASRGASPVVLVESDRKKRPVICTNMAMVETEIILRMQPAERFVRSCRKPYKIIYADPPFSWPKKRALLVEISERGIVEDEGILIIHHPKHDDPGEDLGAMGLSDRRTYGHSILSFYRKR